MVKKVAIEMSSQASLDFDQIYRDYHRLIRSVIFKINGPVSLDDLVQETFLKVWKKYHHFEHRSQLKTWIYRIAVNVTIDFRRRNKKVDLNEELNNDLVDPSNEFNNQSNQDLVSKALLGLSDEHRQVIVLHFLEDLSVKDVAFALQISTGTVKSRIHHAKANMRKALRKVDVSQDVQYRRAQYE